MKTMNKIRTLATTAGICALLAACGDFPEPVSQLPALVTGDATDVYRYTASLSGQFSYTETVGAVNRCGILYSNFPSMAEAKELLAGEVKSGQTFELSLSDLTPDTELPVMSTVTYEPVDRMPAIQATASLLAAGVSPVVEMGFCWDTQGVPTLNSLHKAGSSADGKRTTARISLKPNTTYYVCAYATNERGETGYRRGYAARYRLCHPCLCADHQGLYLRAEPDGHHPGRGSSRRRHWRLGRHA